MYFHRATPMAAMPMAPLWDVSQDSIATFSLQNLPRVAATKLLAQVRDQQPEALKDERMFALRIIADGLLQNLVGRFMAVDRTLRFNRVRDTVGHAVCSSHDGRLEAQERLSGQTHSLRKEEDVRA